MKEIDIEEVRKRCESDQIKWSLHAFKRLHERNISKDDYKNSIFTGEIIEHYPQSARLPSCLICGQSLKQMPLHNVTGYDEEYLYAVAAYYPEPDKWENDFKTRRVK